MRDVWSQARLRAAARGEIPSIRVGRRMLVLRAALDRSRKESAGLRQRDPLGHLLLPLDRITTIRLSAHNIVRVLAQDGKDHLYEEYGEH